jgi:hypothetical protein
VVGIRKIINSLPLRQKIASQFSSSAYVRIISSGAGFENFEFFILFYFQCQIQIQIQIQI